MKRWLIPLIAAAGIVYAILYVNSANPEPPIGQPAVTPTSPPYKEYIAGAGLTEPSSENIAIGTHIGGIVTAVYVKPGDSIKTGDKLFTIDDREIRAQVEVAKAQLNEAEADLADREDQLEMLKKITDPRAVTMDELNRKTFAVEMAINRVESAHHTVDQLETELLLHTVVAPISGTVLSSNIRIGEFAQTGTMSDPLLRIGTISPMHLRIDIDENDAWRFRAGARAIAYVRGNPELSTTLSFVRVDPYVRPKRSLTGGSLERVDTRVLQVIYSFDPSALPVFVGQQMDVYIEVGGVVSTSAQGAQ